LNSPNSIYFQDSVFAPVINFDPADPANCNISDLRDGFSQSTNSSSPTLSFCNLFSWMFGVWSYLALADFGQLYDPAYQNTNQTNIFVNDDIFQAYNSFLINSILPNRFDQGLNQSFMGLSLNQTGKLSQEPTTLDLTYLCSQRLLKSWLSLFISVLAADAALLIGAYQLFIFVAGYIQKRRERKDQSNPV